MIVRISYVCLDQHLDSLAAGEVQSAGLMLVSVWEMPKTAPRNHYSNPELDCINSSGWFWSSISQNWYRHTLRSVHTKTILSVCYRQYEILGQVKSAVIKVQVNNSEILVCLDLFPSNRDCNGYANCTIRLHFWTTECLVSASHKMLP